MLSRMVLDRWARRLLTRYRRLDRVAPDSRHRWAHLSDLRQSILRYSRSAHATRWRASARTSSAAVKNCRTPRGTCRRKTRWSAVRSRCTATAANCSIAAVSEWQVNACAWSGRRMRSNESESGRLTGFGGSAAWRCLCARKHPSLSNFRIRSGSRRGTVHCNGRRGFSRKNRSISRDASGPVGSVNEPASLPPDHAWPPPCRIQCSAAGRPASTAWTYRV